MNKREKAALFFCNEKQTQIVWEQLYLSLSFALEIWKKKRQIYF